MFRPDGKQLAFVGVENGGVQDFFALSEGVDEALTDGRAQLFTMDRRGKQHKEGEVCAAIRHVTWSPDGKQVGRAVKQDGKWFVVCGKSRSEGHDEVGNLHFSKDGRRIAFGARRGRELWWRVLKIE